MRHTFPPEPKKAMLPSQVAGFLPGSLETLSNLCLPGQPSARLDRPPAPRSCESHSGDPIHPCRGRTQVGERPTAPRTGCSAQGPGAQRRRPPLHLPALRPQGVGGRRSTGWPGSNKQSGRKPREDGPPRPGSVHKQCSQRTCSRLGYLRHREVNKRGTRAGNGAHWGRTRKGPAPSGKPRAHGVREECASHSGQRGWVGGVPPQTEVCISTRLPQGWARGTPREQGWVAGLVDGRPQRCLEGRGGLVVRDGRPDGHSQSILSSTRPGGGRTKTGHVAPSSPASLETAVISGMCSAPRTGQWGLPGPPDQAPRVSPCNLLSGVVPRGNQRRPRPRGGDTALQPLSL